MNIPKLEEIAPPPKFKMPVYDPVERSPIARPTPLVEKQKIEPKIEPKNYDHLKI